MSDPHDSVTTSNGGFGQPQMVSRSSEKASHKRILSKLSDVHYPATSRHRAASTFNPATYTAPQSTQVTSSESFQNNPIQLSQNTHTDQSLPPLFFQDPRSGKFIPALHHLFVKDASSGKFHRYKSHSEPQENRANSLDIPMRPPQPSGNQSPDNATVKVLREQDWSELYKTSTAFRDIVADQVKKVKHEWEERVCLGIKVDASFEKDKAHTEMEPGFNYANVLMRVPEFRKLKQSKRTQFFEILATCLKAARSLNEDGTSKTMKEATSGLKDIYSVGEVSNFSNEAIEQVWSTVKVAVMDEWNKGQQHQGKA